MTYSKRTTSNNIMYATRLTAQGLSENYAVTLPNYSDNQSIRFQMGKYFEKIKLQTKLESAFNVNEQQQIINGKTIPIGNQQLSVGGGFNTKIEKWLEINCKYRFSKFQNQINGVFVQPNFQQKGQLDLTFYPKKNMLVSLQNEYYDNQFVVQSNQSFFADLVLRYTFTKHKIDLETNLSNIGDTNNMSFVSNSSFQYVESIYYLRPRQFVQKIRFSF